MLISEESTSRLRALTTAEVKVALVVADGLTNQEAGRHLFVSAKTIEFHLGHIYRKLEIHSRTQLANIVAEDRVGGSTMPLRNGTESPRI